MSALFMQWHGRHGLRKIAKKCRFFGQIMIEEFDKMGIKVVTDKNNRFDTVAFDVVASGFSSVDYLAAALHKRGINIRKIDKTHASISFDEMTTLYDLDELIKTIRCIKNHNWYKGIDVSDFSQYEGM